MVENVTQIKSGITINVGANIKIQNGIMCAKKYCILDPATCSCENGKDLASILMIQWLRVMKF